jgi:parvulin-like peptidyl-prolyl isomerase
LIPEFADVVFAMQNGELSQPIFADSGWYVIWHHGYQKVTPDNHDEQNMLIAEFSYIFLNRSGLAGDIIM